MYHSQVDVYAFGIVIWEILTDRSWYRTMTRILHCKHECTTNMKLKDILLSEQYTGRLGDCRLCACLHLFIRVDVSDLCVSV